MHTRTTPLKVKKANTGHRRWRVPSFGGRGSRFLVLIGFVMGNSKERIIAGVSDRDFRTEYARSER